MTIVEELLTRLASLDVRLDVDGDQLRIDAPKGVLNPELKQELVKHKPTLIALLGTTLDGIQPAPESAVIPLTSGQERLWSLMELQHGSGVYNVPMAYRLRGNLDIEALEQGLNTIQRRHSALRTRFEAVDGRPQQQVVASLDFAPEIIDLTGLADAERSEAVDKKLDEQIQKPFDLGKAPLWRCTLLLISDDEYVLIFTMHHIVFDLTSKTLFLRELEALYAGEDAPKLTIEYRDFAYWQQSKAQRNHADSQMDYWEANLDGIVGELLLPTDHPRPASTRMDGRSRAFAVPAQVATKLNKVCRATKSSMYMTLLAAFHALLHRYTGQTEQIICSPFSCRNSTSVEALIGYFNNILPIRSDLSGDPSFRELLRRVRQVTMDAMKHQDAPFQRIAKLPNLVRTPLTRAMFNYRGEDSTELKLRGLSARPIQNRRTQADFDLALYMGIENGCLCGVLDYSSELFHERTMRSLLKNFQATLLAVSENPDQPLSALPTLRPTFPDIENALTHHPKVDQAVVVTRSDGLGSNRVAYLVLNEDDVPSQMELQAAVQERVIGKLAPLRFMPLDQIPTLADGTLDPVSLPAPTFSGAELDHEYVAPRTELEHQLAEIWQRILWSDQKVGIHDNFFDLGGHSLLSVQLIAEIEEQLGRSVPLENLGQLSTISKLVTALDKPVSKAVRSTRHGLGIDILRQLQSYTAAWSGKRAGTESLITGLNTEGSKQSVFWVVQRYLNLAQFAKHLGPDQPIYGMRSGHNVMGYSLEDSKALAHYYVEEILQIQSSGPFIIGGICQASEIAFQIAQRLQDRGHEVNLLVLQERFIPQDYPGRVAFLFGDVSDRNPYYHFARPELGWRKYYTGGIDVHIVRGAHGTFFQERNIQSLTREMELAFERAGSTISQSFDETITLQCLAQSAYQARLTVTNASDITSGEARLAVKIENVSSGIWLASERSGVLLGARWLNPNNRDVKGHDRYVQANSARTPLTTDLEPGSMLELELTVTIPDDPQFDTLEVDMVDEGLTWFSDAGSTPAQIEFQRN